MKSLLSEKRMSSLSAALPCSIYISRGLIYNSGNSLIYCKTKKKKLFPQGLSAFVPCFVLQVARVGWEPGELRQGERRAGGAGFTAPRKGVEGPELRGKPISFSRRILYSPKQGTLEDSKY